MNLLLIALGGAFGSVTRFLMINGIGRWLGSAFPYGTLLVNVLGSFLMGLLVGVLARLMPPQAEDLRLLLGIGVLGGFTTFSAFSLDVVTLIQRGEMLTAMVYVAVSVIFSIVALFLGIALLRGIGA